MNAQRDYQFSSEHVKFEVYIGHSAGGLEDFQMYESRNLGMVRPIDKYLTIWSLQILFEIKRIDEIFKGDSRFFFPRSPDHIFSGLYN